MALTDQLSPYYNFNSNSNDSVGSANGTDNNSPTYTSGKIGNALTLVAASTQYVSMPNGILPWGTNTFTVNMWVKLSSTGGNQALIGTFRPSQGMICYKSGTNTITFSKPNVIDLNYTWTGIDTSYHMWTFVADGSGMRIYLDGNSTAVASNGNTSNITAPSTDTIEFGVLRSAGSILAGWYLDGQMDEVGIWTRALSTTEISELYNSGAGFAYPFVTTPGFPTVNTVVSVA